MAAADDNQQAGRGKRPNFSADEDIILVREVCAAKENVAGSGQVRLRFDDAATSANANPNLMKTFSCNYLTRSRGLLAVVETDRPGGCCHSSSDSTLSFYMPSSWRNKERTNFWCIRVARETRTSSRVDGKSHQLRDVTAF